MKSSKKSFKNRPKNRSKIPKKSSKNRPKKSHIHIHIHENFWTKKKHNPTGRNAAKWYLVSILEYYAW